MAQEELEYLWFKDWIDSEEHKRQDWIVVARHYPQAFSSPYFTQSALLPNDDGLLDELFQEASCGFSPDDAGKPGYSRSGDDLTYYSDSASMGHLPFRAFTIHRTFPIRYPTHCELLQEFVLYHEAYYEQDRQRWVTFDRTGQDLVVAKRYETDLGEHGIKVSVGALRDFLTTGPFVLVRGHDHRREDASVELTEEEIGTETVRDDDRRFDVTVSNRLALGGEWSSRLLGSDIVRPLPQVPRERRWWDDDADRYERFIIGLDDDGQPIERSCGGARYEEDGVEGADGLTSVYFRLEVLDKYRNDPERYAGGEPQFGDVWGLQYDVNDADLVQVYLADIEMIPYEEQQYWKQFNVSPDGGISRERVLQDFMLQPQPPRDLARRLRHALDQVNLASRRRLGDDLFSPLSPADGHVVGGLCYPIVDRWGDFDEQVGALAKLLCDSINVSKLQSESDLKINKKEGPIRGSIDLLEHALIHFGAEEQDAADMVKGLRAVQSLRSAGVAHRRGDRWEQAIAREAFEGMSCPEIHKELIMRLLASLDHTQAFLQSLDASKDEPADAGTSPEDDASGDEQN